MKTQKNTHTTLPFLTAFLTGLAIVMVFSSSAFAAAVTSETSGKWRESNTWTNNVIPGASDEANIRLNHEVWLDSGDYTVKAVRLGFGAGSDSSLIIGGNGTLANLTVTTTPNFGRSPNSTGTLTIREMGLLTTTALTYVTYESNATSTVNIEGGEWNHTATGNVVLGHVLAAATAKSTGTIKITDGGKFSANASTVVLGVNHTNKVGGNGDISIDNGSFYANNLLVGNGVNSVGTVTLANGTLDIKNELTIGLNGGVGTVTMSDGIFDAAENVKVGSETGSRGTINIEGGILTAKKAMYVGNQEGGNGTLNVSGTGRLVVNSNLNLAYFSSNGALNLSDSGSIQVDGNFNAGYSGGAKAISKVNISGGSLTVDGNLNIGFNSTSTFDMTGGSIDVGGTLSLAAGTTPGVQGTMNLTNISSARFGNLIVGAASLGEVTLKNSTMVITGDARLNNGTTRNGTGTVNLLNGSRMDVGGDFIFSSSGVDNKTRTNALSMDASSRLMITGNLVINDKGAGDNRDTITFKTGANGELGGITAGGLVFNSGTGVEAKIIVDLSAFTKEFSGPLHIALLTITGKTDVDIALDLISFVENADGSLIDLVNDDPVFSWKSNGVDSIYTLTLTGLSQIPEPSTYAAILGALGILAIILRRRR